MDAGRASGRMGIEGFREAREKDNKSTPFQGENNVLGFCFQKEFQHEAITKFSEILSFFMVFSGVFHT